MVANLAIEPPEVNEVIDAEMGIRFSRCSKLHRSLPQGNATGNAGRYLGAFSSNSIPELARRDPLTGLFLTEREADDPVYVKPYVWCAFLAQETLNANSNYGLR